MPNKPTYDEILAAFREMEKGLIGFKWGSYNPTTGSATPVTVTNNTDQPMTVHIAGGDEPTPPHVLEPKPTLKCTCGSASVGGSGHSSWCDSLQ